MFRRRRAFTLIETLIIIAIIGLLVAVLTIASHKRSPIDKIFPIYAENQIVTLIILNEPVQIIEVVRYSDHFEYKIRRKQDLQHKSYIYYLKVREGELIPCPAMDNAVVSNN